MIARAVASLAATVALGLASGATAATIPGGQAGDPIGDLIGKVAATVQPILASFGLKATLYHSGGGMSDRDSIGCHVVPMRTAAVDGVQVHRHDLLFIKETVGMPMPDGRRHDGYWYASDTGGGIHKGRIDLFTGHGAGSMAVLMPLNLATLTVAKVGVFQGCPQS